MTLLNRRGYLLNQFHCLNQKYILIYIYIYFDPIAPGERYMLKYKWLNIPLTVFHFGILDKKKKNLLYLL